MANLLFQLYYKKLQENVKKLNVFKKGLGLGVIVSEMRGEIQISQQTPAVQTHIFQRERKKNLTSFLLQEKRITYTPESS